MTRPTQTDRLEAGLIATFSWRTCVGEPAQGSWRIVEHLDREHGKEAPLPVASLDWLEAFRGRPVGHTAEVPFNEGNILTLTLESLALPNDR